MRRLILLSLLAAGAIPAGAAKRVNVAQLEGTIRTAVAAHKSDGAVARQIGGMELSERLTDVSFGRLKVQLSADPHAVQALQLLADQSAFLQPPASELPATSAPDAAAQQRMLDAARNYVAQTLPRLPNFLATRTINRYDDTPQAETKGGWGARVGLHLVDSSSHEISVRDERENQPPTQSSAVWREQFGLISGGEFGTTLGMILTDTLEGRVVWSHWEQETTGVSAVFQYSVPRSASHFEVIGSRERMDRVGLGSVTRGSAPSGVGVQPGDPTNTMMVRARPSYHGSLWIDPTSGTVLRITIEADAKDGTPFRRAGILVQYGPVHIADSTFICPIRSMALSMADPDPHALMSDAPTEWLNQTLFSGYHRFASTTRILSDTRDAQIVNPDEARQGGQEASTQPVTPAGEPLDRSTPSTASTTISSAKVPLQSAAAQSGPPPAVAAPMAPAAVSAPAEFAANQPVTLPANEPDRSAPILKLNVDRVLIPVVIRDNQGHALNDLKKGDFQVFDEGKLRAISAFAVERRGAQEANAAGETESGAQQPVDRSAALQSPVLPNRITVFLFDDMHLNFEDAAHCQKAGVNALGDALSGSAMAAVVSTSGKINSGLTQDRAKLEKAIMSLRPEGIYQTDANECPKIDYYQADLIVNKHDATATQDALGQVMTVCDPKAPTDLAARIVDSAAIRMLNLGSQDVLTTYAAIGEYARRMGKLPGERTLILVSSGFMPVDEQARMEESRVLDLAARSNVVISALDARGLATASVTASDDTRGRGPGLIAEYRRNSMQLEEEALGELADGTGGSFFHNRNDLDAGLKALAHAPETVYLLELSLDGVKADGKYHDLKIKVDRSGVDIQARRGYFIPKPAKTKK